MKIATDEVDAHGVGSDPDAMLALRARNDPEAFGLLYALAYFARGRLSDAVHAHAVSNVALLVILR